MAKRFSFAFPLLMLTLAVILVSKNAPAATAVILARNESTSYELYLHKKQDMEENFPGAGVARKLAQSSSNYNAFTVDQQAGNFKTVQAAVDAVPTNNNQRVTIQIKAGTYSEKVTIPSSKPFITFQGAGGSNTIISWGDTASSSGGTFQSATVAVDSDNFIAKDIGFKNTAPAPPPGAEGKQAVALRISGDKAAFYRCNFYGAQDTLYDQQGRHYFSNCFIQGSIDFIFGNGQSYYTGCELHSIASTIGSVTAQKRGSAGESTGFSFWNCRITGTGTLYLGRAWGPYSRVVYGYTHMDNIITPEGWNDFGVPDRQKTVFYGQYKCSGPGADESHRVQWSHELTDTEAQTYQTVSFIQGQQWLESA